MQKTVIHKIIPGALDKKETCILTCIQKFTAQSYWASYDVIKLKLTALQKPHGVEQIHYPK